MWTFGAGLVVVGMAMAGCRAPGKETQTGADSNAADRSDGTYEAKSDDARQRANGNATKSATNAVQTPTGDSGSGTFVEVFPDVLMDRENKVIVLRGTVPIDAGGKGDGKAKAVYLETLVCSRDTKEHESLVVVNARPSHVHAALLLLGLEPGTVGTWREANGTVVGTEPTGPPVEVSVRWQQSGYTKESLIMGWVIDQRTGQSPRFEGRSPFLFAGSRFGSFPDRASPGTSTEVYMADVDGTLVGLSTFSSECIAFLAMHHPQSRFEEPRWIANGAVMPAFGTAVEVVISLAR